MKLSIISAKPQTTRNNIRAIVNRPDAQIVFVDTPGVHKPQNELSRFMVDSSVRAAQYADVIAFMVDGRFSGPGEPERSILEKIGRFKKPIVLLINKADDVAKESILPIIGKYSALYDFTSIIPISARTGDGVEDFLEEVIRHLPSGPVLSRRGFHGSIRKVIGGRTDPRTDFEVHKSRGSAWNRGSD